MLQTVQQALRLVDSHRRPAVLLERVETVICGRVKDCVVDFEKCLTRESTRVLRISEALHGQLVSRGAGEVLSQLLGALFRARSVRRWNRSSDQGFKMPPPEVQGKAIREMVRAVEFMPHDPSMIEALVRILVQEDHLSPAEQRPLLQQALQQADAILARGAGSEEDNIRELRREVLLKLDPEQAERETQEEVNRVLRKRT